MDRAVRWRAKQSFAFSNLESAEAGPAIMKDADFPAVMKPFVTWTT